MKSGSLANGWNFQKGTTNNQESTTEIFYKTSTSPQKGSLECECIIEEIGSNFEGGSLQGCTFKLTGLKGGFLFFNVNDLDQLFPLSNPYYNLKKSKISILKEFYLKLCTKSFLSSEIKCEKFDVTSTYFGNFNLPYQFFNFKFEEFNTKIDEFKEEIIRKNKFDEEQLDILPILPELNFSEDIAKAEGKGLLNWIFGTILDTKKEKPANGLNWPYWTSSDGKVTDLGILIKAKNDNNFKLNFKAITIDKFLGSNVCGGSVKKIGETVEENCKKVDIPCHNFGEIIALQSI
ncbi:hypothetical protein HK099_002518 [Clydaea vesicula]|uniref:Uncharacterized protein n=1 Tax=Clydaea vesicula TaxID=447962 RepID=A0AAD5U446_9FUNG|nr:hypothetical protein HK099_002518 [Clydaea vesicula]KAJ3389548.1 hypothetical protein HDU92_000969 [Lobulomyces angularis]